MPTASGDRVFGDALAEVYGRDLVPLIFAPYADALADRIAALSPASVLEIAAGTGPLTRALGARLPASSRLVASDLSPAMLAQAQRIRTPQSPAASSPRKWKTRSPITFPTTRRGS
jgi:trans-aconitate methyltransferase